MDSPDPALKQLHLYVCMMIELGNYAMTSHVKQVFELCKGALRKKVEDFPLARNVIQQYINVVDPHSMERALCTNNYTDEYVADVNTILEDILLMDTSEDIAALFEKLTCLT
jgi:superfamily II helicase